MIRRIGFLILGLLGAAILALGVAAIVLSRMDWRPRIESLVSARLGRPLTIEGFAIGWGNPLTLEITGLRLANPAWGSTPDMVAIRRLHAAIAPWPLLHGELRLSQMVAERPVIVLERDTDGTGNWVFPGSGKQPAGSAGPAPVPFIADLRLQDGDLTFRTTQHHLLRVHVGQAALQAADDRSPVTLHAEGSYNDLKLVADSTLESFAALRQVPRPVATEIAIAARRSTLKFKGTMTDPIGFDGIKGDVELAAGTSEEFSEAFERPRIMEATLTLKGVLDKQGDHWRLTELDGVIADAPVTGSVGLDEGKRGQPDHIDINLGIASLDLLRLSDRLTPNPRPANQSKGIPLQVEENPGETYKVRIGIQQAVYGRYRLDGVSLEGSREPGRITLDKLSFGIADGRVDLSGTNETAGEGGRLRLEATLSQMNAARLVAMAGADASMLSGRFDARATLDMTGRSTQDGLGASRGQAVLSMAGGQVSRQFLQLASIDLRLLLRKGQGTTSVVCFLAVGDMRNGVASVAPLRLRTREGDLSGGGQVDLLRDALDLRLKSDRRSTHFWALDIPVRITGSLSNPKAGPALSSEPQETEARAAANLRLLPPGLRELASLSRC